MLFPNAPTVNPHVPSVFIVRATMCVYSNSLEWVIDFTTHVKFMYDENKRPVNLYTCNMYIIKSFYLQLKSSVKCNNTISDTFLCTLGVAQGDCLSPFSFTMYINDLEETLLLKGHLCIDIHMLKIYVLLYADDIVLMSETAADLQNALNNLKA